MTVTTVGRRSGSQVLGAAFDGLVVGDGLVRALAHGGHAIIEPMDDPAISTIFKQ